MTSDAIRTAAIAGALFAALLGCGEGSAAAGGDTGRPADPAAAGAPAWTVSTEPVHPLFGDPQIASASAVAEGSFGVLQGFSVFCPAPGSYRFKVSTETDSANAAYTEHGAGTVWQYLEAFSQEVEVEREGEMIARIPRFGDLSEDEIDAMRRADRLVMTSEAGDAAVPMSGFDEAIGAVLAACNGPGDLPKD